MRGLSVGLRARAQAMAREMDWFRGLRAGVALSAPLVLGDVLGIANLGWAALGGFEAILSDTGGSYRTRLNSLATLTLGGSVGVFLGALVGGSLYWALPVTVLWCFLWSYLAVLGQPFASAGVLVQVIFICGIGAPAANWREALGIALLLLAGGAWAVVLSLFLWPLDAYRPARHAVSDCYQELASFLGSVADLADREQHKHQRASLWHRLAQHHQYRIRKAVERAWHAVAMVRAERMAETAQGYLLVVLLESADMLIARTVSFAEHLETQVGEATSGSEGCIARGVSGLEELRSAELWVSSFLLRRRSETADTARKKCEELRGLPVSLAGCMGQVDASSRFLLEQVAASASLLETAVESASQLQLGRAINEPASRRAPAASAGHFGYVYERIGALRQGWDLGLLAANLRRDSLTLRHAVRVALVCGLDVALILMLHIDHGYWLLMTSLIVLQPHVSGTLRRGLERIGGTVGGGIVAALLAMTLHSQLVTAAVLFPCALLALALMPVSYAAFAFFLTPAFVLAWMPYAGDWQLALFRIGNTVAGAVIAVVAMMVLFPAYERERAPKFLRASVAADRRYLGELAASWRLGSKSSRVLANARRVAGLAHNDTEESLERLLTETWPRRQPFAQFATAFVTYLRRFAQGTTMLTSLEGDWAWKQSEMVQKRLQLLDRRLGWIEEQVSDGGVLPGEAWPEAVETAAEDGHPGERQLDRLDRQSWVLHRHLLSLRANGWIPGAPRS